MILPGTYRHYKGGYYEVIGAASHSETLEDMVVYRNVSSDEVRGRLWVRPLSSFMSTVDVNGIKMSRFSPVSYANEERTKDPDMMSQTD